MAVRYNKLWKILIDKKMEKKDLQEAAHLTQLARPAMYEHWPTSYH